MKVIPLHKQVLTALPVYNEVAHLTPVLDQVVTYANNVLVVDDGSNDGTSELLAKRSDIQLLRHETNQGYGAALISAFQFAIKHKYDVLVTLDCDGQHEPQRIPELISAANDADIVSGSRYLKDFDGDNPAPQERREINQEITALINQKLDLNLTDAFCGFKAYSICALKKLNLKETGYAMPIELWVKAAALVVHSITVTRAWRTTKMF